MQKAKLLMLALIAAGIWCLPGPVAGENAPDGVRQAAAAGLAPFLAKLTPELAEDLGFTPAEPPEKAGLGEPYQLHTITPASLAQHQPGMAVKSLLTPTAMWYFPVRVAGQGKGILVVDKLNDQWQAVSLGYAGLARELDAMERQWPAAAGYHPILIAVFQARQYLVTIPEKGAANLTRLKADTARASALQPAAAPAGKYKELGAADEVLGQLKPIIQNALP